VIGADFIKAQLTLISWRDGGSEGLNGALACAFTIRNRLRAGFYGSDWIALLSHHQDYAASSVSPQYDLPDPRNYAFNQLLQQIDGIFAGTTEDDITAPSKLFSGGPVGQVEHSFAQPSPPPALYYGRLNDINIREWFLESISRNTEQHRLIATVGSLSFFS
jgi:hypothetical protein